MGCDGDMSGTECSPGRVLCVVSARDKDNQRLLMLIRDSYSLSGGVYGYRRVQGDLNEFGGTCGKNRVSRIMQLNVNKVVRGYKAPRRIAGRPSVVAPNRVRRQFTVVTFFLLRTMVCDRAVPAWLSVFIISGAIQVSPDCKPTLFATKLFDALSTLV